MALPRSGPRCPNCQTPLPMRVEQLIDAERDPGAKARLLSGTLNRVRCPTCGWDGLLAVPLVYHDPGKELLLTYMPLELGLPKPEQERMIGALIKEATSRLPPERRKAYLLTPQAVLTPQSLVERVLEADGVTREQLDEQRARIRLLEDLLRAPDESLEGFVAEHDAKLDDLFFQLASLSLQTARDTRAAQAASQRLDRAFERSSYGRRVAARQAEIQAAAEDLGRIKEPVTREAVLDLLIQAASDDRVSALATLARPVLDYGFFQILSDRIEATQGDERDRLTSLRARLLRITQEVDAAQEERLGAAGAVLQSLVQADDLDAAIQRALPAIDDLFMSVLAANLDAARQRNETGALQALERIDRRLREIIRDALPPSLRLAQEVVEEDDEVAARRRIDASAEAASPEFLSTLLAMAGRLGEAGDAEGASRLERLHRHAVGVSMRRKMAEPKPGDPGPEG